MAMEYAKGGDLYNYVKAYGHLKEPVARCASSRGIHECSLIGGRECMYRWGRERDGRGT